MPYKKTLFFLSTLSVSIHGLSAEEPAALETVVVTGRRTEARLLETPQRIEIIDKTDIERTPSRELTDLLKKNSSVDVIQYPGNLSGIGIRGFRPEFSGINKHSLLLIDGRPAMSTNLSLVNMNQVERIEVLKGPSSALYGSSAMGGVINLITHESKGKISGFGQVGYGHYDTKEVKGAIGGAINSTFDFDYSGSWFDQSHDFRLGNGDIRPNTEYSQQSHALRLGANLNENWRLSLKTDVYRGRDIATPGDIADGVGNQSNKDMDRDGTELSLNGRIADHLLRARLFKGKEAYTLYKKSSLVAAERPYLPFRSFASDIQWNGWQVQDAWSWSDSASLVFGIDVEKAQSVTRSYLSTGSQKAPYSADNKRETVGIYAENTWYFNDNNSTVYVGGRHDKIKVSTLDTPLKTGFTPSSSDFTHTSPSAGFKHLFAQGFRLHGTVGKGFVTPDAASMTGYAESVVKGITTITRGNPSLKPETSTTYDLGLEWSSGAFYADATLFHTRVKDKISSLITSINPTTNLSTSVNASQAEMEGLELEGRWQINAHLRLSLGGTHYFYRREMADQQWRDINNVPRNTLRAAMNVDYGPWSGRFGVRHVGTWKDNFWAGNSSQIISFDSFTTADLSLRYRFDKHQSISANVENLFDRFYAEKGGYPLPGRNGKISYRYDF